MATWNSRGLRGSTLEDLINYTIEIYRERKLAVIQKVPTPITPIEIDKSSRHITLAYFDQKSTVDYLGAVQGIPVCFDAKECAVLTFPLANIHEHQVRFMRDFEEQGGVSFLIIYFSKNRAYYYMRRSELLKFWDRCAKGGRKSFTCDELDRNYFLDETNNMVPILVGLQKDLDEREEANDE